VLSVIRSNVSSIREKKVRIANLKERIEEAFLKKAIALCQDTDYEVRSAMSDQLNAICRAVG
jgi:hypothetical protein